MASRLSEESVVEVLETGHQGLAVEGGHAFDLLEGGDVDLDKIVDTENPDEAVQAIEPHRMYRALVKRGPEDCIEVLPHLSQEQVVRIFDYDAWQEDRLEPYQAIRWLSLFREVSHEEFIKRFRELDEEYQSALLNPYVEVIDEEAYEQLSQDEQDKLHAMPGNAFYYRIKSEDPRIVEFISGLVDSGLMVDIEYVQALLSHAGLMPPNEQEQLLRQFRRARIEEDGFVTYEESVGAFRRLDLDGLRKKWPEASGHAAAAPVDPQAGMIRVGAHAGKEPILSQAMKIAAAQMKEDEFEQLTRSFAFLANSLAAAGKVETDDQAGMRRLLSYAQAFVSVCLDWLSGGQAERAAEILRHEHPKTLFRGGLSLVYGLQDAVADRFERFHVPGVERMKKCLQLDKRGLLLHQLDTRLTAVLGFEKTEMLKGLFNRYPVKPQRLTLEADGVQRVIFTRLVSVDDLRELGAEADALCGLLYLANLARGFTPGELHDLERVLLTAVARVLVDGGFREERFNAADLVKLEALTADEAQERLHGFLTSLEDTLTKGFAVFGVSGSLRCGETLGTDAEAALQSVLSAFTDMVLRLSAAREQALKAPVGSFARHMSLLIDTDESCGREPDVKGEKEHE